MSRSDKKTYGPYDMVNTYDLTWKKHVHKLTIGNPRAKLFNFFVAGLQRVIYPVDNIMPR